MGWAGIWSFSVARAFAGRGWDLRQPGSFSISRTWEFLQLQGPGDRASAPSSQSCGRHLVLLTHQPLGQQPPESARSCGCLLELPEAENCLHTGGQSQGPLPFAGSHRAGSSSMTCQPHKMTNLSFDKVVCQLQGYLCGWR